jgi:GNAT superfamily N-acetyltransferase
VVGESRAEAPIEIRAAEPGDLSALVALSLAAARSDRGWAGGDWMPPDGVTARQLWWARLRDQGAWVGVAVSGFTRMGCAAAWPAPTLQGRAPKLAYVTGPVVDPEWWGEGIGGALLAEGLEALATRQFARAENAIPAGNRRGRAFFERHGWHQVEQPPRRSPMAIVVYARELDGGLIENRSQYAA